MKTHKAKQNKRKLLKKNRVYKLNSRKAQQNKTNVAMSWAEETSKGFKVETV